MEYLCKNETVFRDANEEEYDDEFMCSLSVASLSSNPNVIAYRTNNNDSNDIADIIASHSNRIDESCNIITDNIESFGENNNDNNDNQHDIPKLRSETSIFNLSSITSDDDEYRKATEEISPYISESSSNKTNNNNKSNRNSFDPENDPLPGMVIECDDAYNKCDDNYFTDNFESVTIASNPIADKEISLNADEKDRNDHASLDANSILNNTRSCFYSFGSFYNKQAKKNIIPPKVKSEYGLTTVSKNRSSDNNDNKQQQNKKNIIAELPMNVKYYSVLSATTRPVIQNMRNILRTNMVSNKRKHNSLPCSFDRESIRVSMIRNLHRSMRQSRKSRRSILIIRSELRKSNTKIGRKQWKKTFRAMRSVEKTSDPLLITSAHILIDNALRKNDWTRKTQGYLLK